MKRRKVFPGEVHHVYQRTVGGVLVFYSASDYLVFFTLFCTIAKRSGVRILALCPMVDHLHHVCVVNGQRQLSDFVKVYTQEFAKIWNRSRGRKGSLFHPRFGSAPKIGGKKVRTALAYNDNNPVERKLVEKAEEYRWNFLSYATGETPWSAPVDKDKISRPMQLAMEEMSRLYNLGKYLGYRQLERWSKRLKQSEFQQLIDYIITLWNILDYDEAASYYGSFDKMIRAIHDNTGSEWDIHEEIDPYSDAVYADCTRILLQGGYIKDVNQIPSLPDERKYALLELLQSRTVAKRRQLYKYLHL